MALACFRASLARSPLIGLPASSSTNSIVTFSPRAALALLFSGAFSFTLVEPFLLSQSSSHSCLVQKLILGKSEWMAGGLLERVSKASGTFFDELIRSGITGVILS